MDNNDTRRITKLILEAAKKAQEETTDIKTEPEFITKVKWPVACVVGPGLEGAIACESKVGYVNGKKGELIYRGYNIYDLCAYSSFEEVSYLLIHGSLPTQNQLTKFKKELSDYRNIPDTISMLLNFPIKEMDPMAALRVGTNLLRREATHLDEETHKPDYSKAISSDEDSIPMETLPLGEKHAIYEFKRKQKEANQKKMQLAAGYKSCYKLIAGLATIAAAIARIRDGHLPIEPDPELGHAANLLYMVTGRKPTAVEEKIMDIALILHADHGMNASTFATMVVASTLSDMYFAVGSGIAALNGPLHGGANVEVVRMLNDISSVGNVDPWFKKTRAKKIKISGFGHRVYKAYDPRARVLAPLAEYLINNSNDQEAKSMLKVAKKLEKKVVKTLGKEKKIFPNVDFYSGIVYNCLNIPLDLFTTFFAVSRVSGWTARVMEYLQHNRIFRPRAVYTGQFNKSYKSTKESS
jgi:citrate synthase